MASYSVPTEAEQVFRERILSNPLMQKNLTTDVLEASNNISFEGNDKPSLPVNWRFAESISALKAYEATMLNVLLKRKYEIPFSKININTDHAQLYFMSLLLWTIDPDGANVSAGGSLMLPEGRALVAKYFPSCDLHRGPSFAYQLFATNIYRTKDNRFFHLHGSLNAEIIIRALGLPVDSPSTNPEDYLKTFVDAVGSRTAEELQELSVNARQSGTICWTTEEYKNSEHGKANADIGLFRIRPSPNPNQKPSWWPATPQTSASRPLAGLKVVDLTRVIAGPAICRELAELGASVMRITAPHITDMSVLHPDLSHGKWNAHLDLRKEEDREKLRDLILEADVFVQGYRPGILDKYGFGEKDILELVKNRDRGIIYCGENCYGWEGPWQHRSGWQQVSDANCGVSYEFGRAMGNDEPVTPIFPNSDYCTGVVGATSILTALIQRAEQGGSFSVDVALNYYSQWLVNSVGQYPDDVWQEVWKSNGQPVFRHHNYMQHLIPRVMPVLQKVHGHKLFQPQFFTQYHPKSLGKDMRIVAPVIRFPNGEVNLKFNVGARTNGVDKAYWPADLTTEFVQ